MRNTKNGRLVVSCTFFRADADVIREDLAYESISEDSSCNGDTGTREGDEVSRAAASISDSFVLCILMSEGISRDNNGAYSIG